MNKETINKIRLGLFVVGATVFFVVAMYFIGKKENMFGPTFSIGAVFNNVSGLQGGNNVRFSGIDVGTVKNLVILSDTSIRVDMIIEEDIRQYIKVDAIASIGTDGLMGNKLVNISHGSPDAKVIEEFALLPTLDVLDADVIMRRLEQTNTNAAIITEELVEIARKINSGEGIIGNLLTDTTLAWNVNEAIVNIKLMSDKTNELVGSLAKSIDQIILGEGTMSALLMDTVLAENMQRTVKEIMAASEKTEKITEELKGLMERINRGEGVAGRLLADTATATSLENSLKHIEEGSKAFSENMEALKHNFLFRRYFKKQDKGKVNE